MPLIIIIIMCLVIFEIIQITQISLSWFYIKNYPKEHKKNSEKRQKHINVFQCPTFNKNLICKITIRKKFKNKVHQISFLIEINAWINKDGNFHKNQREWGQWAFYNFYFCPLEWILIGLFINLSVPEFQPLIVIYRRGTFV